VVDDQDIGAVGVAHDVGGEHRGRGTRGDNAAAGDEMDGVAEQRGQAEVMDRGQDRHAELGDKLQDLDLIPDIEMISRLVQDQVVGALGDGRSDQDSLLLAPRQRVEAAVGQVRAADLRHRLLRDRPVGLVVAVERPLVRGPADHHHLRDGEVELEGELLADHRDPPGGVLGPERQQVSAVQEHPPGGGTMDPVDGLEDGRLPAPVRPEQAGEAAVGHPEADVGDDPAAADVHRQAVQLQAHRDAPYR
jgi:hypothetical protein